MHDKRISRRGAPEPGTGRTPAAPTIRRALLAWYRAHRRDLPWRRTRDPYAVWVSEVMLQQTQVTTVEPYFDRWMRRFPTVEALARSEEPDVLEAWEGLGYYSRARNLRRAAQAVTDRHGGQLPSDVDALRALPGIGPYSAGAIASIAFGRPAPIVDGNVVRVLCRLYGLRGDPARAPLKRALWSLAEHLVPDGAAADFNQAMMELGATVCSPTAPACSTCPLRRSCIAHRDGLQSTLPQARRRQPALAVQRVAATVCRSARLLLVQAPADAKRWANLWQFPNTDIADGETAEQAARRALGEFGLAVNHATHRHTLRHTITHHRVTLEVWACRASGRARSGTYQRVEWLAPADLARRPMPAPHRRIAERLSELAL